MGELGRVCFAVYMIYSQLGARHMVHVLCVSGFEEVGVSCCSASDAQLLECSEEEARRILGSAYAN